LTKLYRESFPVSTGLKKVKDVTIEDLIQFAQNRADVLKNKLPKVKELSYYSALKRKTDKWRKGDYGDKYEARNAQAAELLDIQKRFQQVLDKHSKKVANLQGARRN
jgi:hypothetical protein